ncbi:hypothetical protein BTHERMOSOX_1842 [Bathymodiolus thermophilus thioautotrophic gill symbiont]|uniref:Methylase-associated X1 domain-containing protein n=1 Tax=Bathymodiolus thermophilus thioautotrophic gill symbiont TaxID=2360 RepID=A0A8H9CF40_9GAMM|nr:hypothetical protein [Bathymodiolus thermophilus thioautotrophic gill symbiont]CAB5496357.1 hypothetical protein THERMOS_492 [Bathymodiolus thermophilus thioautotrophic gill symbiont]SGZ92295.1 hypothetical protein BTHERMOSOX_1842 [Bathymodiolus thermophilus thioautotrophic gill symbiont]
MPIKVEQVTETGAVVEDYDAKPLTPSEIKTLLLKQKGLKIITNKNPFEAKYKEQDIFLCVKNISYLGIPHLPYKKRIQIPKTWQKTLQQNNALLLGIYTYKQEITFCLFNTKKYKNNALNNSSAHIHTMDLHKARENGIFNKIDKKGNEITVFTEQNFEKVLDALFSKNALSNELSVFDEFSKTLDVKWDGIDCYQEMMKNNFKQAYQPEWAGFYLEYKFEEFLNNNPGHMQYCQYKQNKTSNGIDLDLWFTQEKFFGDLKAHTIGGTLLGNDKKNVILALTTYNKVWYVVFVHNTTKDKECNAVVTNFWNKKLNERYKKTGKGKVKKMDSYSKRMKNSVELDQFVVLEINQSNQQYLSNFDQGKNSNNTIRKQKISIKNKDINNDNFVIYRKKL